jgi:hypothetical protein
MFKVSHPVLILISGCIWLAIGCFLLPLGLNFLVQSIDPNYAASRPLIDFIAPYSGLDQAALVLVVVGLAVGYLKGTKIFSKSVQSSVDRILTLSNPAPISQIYTKKYYILLSSMILLGVLVRFLPNDIRGLVDVIIGSALINGAMMYFRRARGEQVKEKV